MIESTAAADSRRARQSDRPTTNRSNPWSSTRKTAACRASAAGRRTSASGQPPGLPRQVEGSVDNSITNDRPASHRSPRTTPTDTTTTDHSHLEGAHMTTAVTIARWTENSLTITGWGFLIALLIAGAIGGARS